MSDGPIPQPGGDLNAGCVTAPAPVYAPGARRYHEDLCQPVAMLPTLRFPCEYPDGPPDWRLGRFEPRSITPIRAVDFSPSPSQEDTCGIPQTSKCRYHHGHITHNRRGRMVPFLASEPFGTKAGDEQINLRRNHAMLVCRLEGDDPEGIIPKGRFFYRGSYQAPWHTDLHVHSFRVHCGSVI